MEEGRRLPFGGELGPDLNGDVHTLLLYIGESAAQSSFRDSLKAGGEESALAVAQQALREKLGSSAVELAFDAQQEEVALYQRDSRHGARLRSDEYPDSQQTTSDSPRIGEIQELAETDFQARREAEGLLRQIGVRPVDATLLSVCTRVLLTARDIAAGEHQWAGVDVESIAAEELDEMAVWDNQPTHREIVRILDEHPDILGRRPRAYPDQDESEIVTLRQVLNGVFFGLLMEFAMAARLSINSSS